MTKVFNSAIMTAFLLYPLSWRTVPTFSHQPLMFYFLLLVTFVFSARYGGICGGREVSDCLPGRGRAHQGAADPQLPKTSDHLVQRWAENSLQQPHVSVLSPRLGPVGGRNNATKHRSDQGVQYCGKISFNLSPHHVRAKQRFMSKFWCRARAHQQSSTPS